MGCGAGFQRATAARKGRTTIPCTRHVVIIPGMPDMLVNLLKLPDLAPLVEGLRGQGVIVRRAQPFELTPVREFVTKHFALGWADEALVGFANKPISVYLAIRDGAIVGFAAYECTRR